MHPILPGTTDQLTSILRGQLQVEAQGDSYVVRTPAFVSATDYVAATLAKPEFAHFLRPAWCRRRGCRWCKRGPDAAGQSDAGVRAEELRRGDHPPDARTWSRNTGRKRSAP